MWDGGGGGERGKGGLHSGLEESEARATGQKGGGGAQKRTFSHSFLTAESEGGVASAFPLLFPPGFTSIFWHEKKSHATPGKGRRGNGGRYVGGGEIKWTFSRAKYERSENSGEKESCYVFS